MEQCATCKWAKALPEAGPEPQDPRPEKPNWLDRIFGSDYIFSYYWEWLQRDYRHRKLIYWEWLQRDYRHRKLISCHRYPRRTNMAKTDLCGEFTPPTGADT